MKTDIFNITDEDLNELFGIGEGWEIYRTKKQYGVIDVKFRKKYGDDAIKFNDDGYEYKSIFINPSYLTVYEVKALNAKGYKTPYNF